MINLTSVFGLAKCPEPTNYAKNLETSVFAVLEFLNQARAGHRPAHAWFLKITSVRMYVCLCVRPQGHE